MNTPENQADKELQEWIEKQLGAGLPADAAASDQGEQPDLDAYRMLFTSLNDKPATGPSYAFSANIITKIQARKDYLTGFKWNFILPVGILLVMFITYIAAAYFHSSFARTVIDLALQFRWQLIFGTCCFFIIQYLDRQLVRKKVLRNY